MGSDPFPHHKLWNILGCSLFFLEALGGALFLPILPALVENLGVGYPASLAAWVGLLVGAFYGGFSGSLGAARLLYPAAAPPGVAVSSAIAPPSPSSFRVGVVLLLSAAVYIACGCTIGRQAPAGLWWLASLRLANGVLAASHRALAYGCLDQTGGVSTRAPVAEGAPQRNRSPQESVGATSGLIFSFAVAGALFSPGHARPLLMLCLVAALAHIPSLVALVLLFLQRRTATNSPSGCYASVDGTPRGGQAGVGLLARSPWRARDSSDGSRNGAVVEEETVTAIATATAPGRGGAGVSGGGGAAPVSNGVDKEMQIPGRYLRGCKGDKVEAERRWRLTLDWREKERVDEVLREPQPHFNIIKRYYPHFMHRRARNGCPVWIELPGRIDLPAIRLNGVSPEALQRHYIFVTEYLWGVVETDFENGQAVTVLDVQGLGMRDLAGEALGFVKDATAIVQDHYVERSNRMFIINAPSYFSFIWRGIRPMLNERTQQKISIISTDKMKITEALLECIPSENLPPQYGGTCPLDLGESEEEKGLRSYVASITPSLGPRNGATNIDGNDGEVEINFHNSSGSGIVAPGPKSSNGAVVAAGVPINRYATETPAHGDKIFPEGEDSEVGNRRGAARRVLGKVRGALGWAGGKLSWRRSPIAHLGDENGFVYDADQHRWVLRQEVGSEEVGREAGDDDRKTEARKSSSILGGGDRGGEQEHSSSPERRGRQGSSTSEEMTVLAIQAAHMMRSEVGTKFSPVPSEVRPISGSSMAGTFGPKSGTFYLPKEGTHEAGRALVLPCPCMKPFGRQASRLDLGSVLYATSTAVREALPIWLLGGAQAGGMGLAPAQIGAVFATGVILARAGTVTVSAGWFSYLGTVGRGGFVEGRRLLHIVRVRLVITVSIGLLYVLSKLLWPPVVPPAVGWLALTVLVAANYTSLELCIISRSQFASSASCLGSGDTGVFAVGYYDNGEGRTRATSSASSCGAEGTRGQPRVAMIICPSGLAGDLFGSVAGPLLLAVALWTGWPPPFDLRWWLLLCLCVDLWLSTGSKEGKVPNTQLLGADGEAMSEGEHDGAGRFGQLV